MVEQLAIRIYYLTTGLILDSYPVPSLFKEMSEGSNTAGGDELAKFRFGLLPPPFPSIFSTKFDPLFGKMQKVPVYQNYKSCLMGDWS